jgi:hypothetical protein
MSWHFSRALVEVYSRADSLGGEPLVQLKLSPMPSLFLPNDKMKDFSRFSQFGIISGLLEENRGEELSIWFRGVFLAKPFQQQPTENLPQMTYGPKCIGSFKKLDLNLFLQKTSPLKPLQKRPQTAVKADIELKHSLFPRQTWAQTITDQDIGLLHTPTTAANYLAPSMYKHQGCKNYIRVFGRKSPRDGQKNPSTKGTDSSGKDKEKQNAGAKLWPYGAHQSPRPNPIDQEWLMGWPPGWTDISPVGMAKFHQWRLQHFLSYVIQQEEALKEIVMKNRCERTDRHLAHEDCIGRGRAANKSKVTFGVLSTGQPNEEGIIRNKISIAIVKFQKRIKALEEAKKLLNEN